MKQLLLCLMVMVSVVKVYGASSQFYYGQTWWSDVRAIAITETTPDEEFTDFTSLDETFTTPDESFTSPVEIIGTGEEIIESDEDIL